MSKALYLKVTIKLDLLLKEPKYNNPVEIFYLVFIFYPKIYLNVRTAC